MYLSLQTVCGCHGYLVFESIYCDRCRSLIPHQISDESLIDPIPTNNTINGMNMKSLQSSKHASEVLLQYQKQHRQQQQQKVTTGRVRFRALCPFCNSPTYVLRYYCRRERIYYHLRIQNFGENEQSIYKTISESQNIRNRYHQKHDRKSSLRAESIDDSYSLNDSIYHQPPSTVIYNQSGIPTAKDTQNENEKNLYALNDLEGDLFNVLRNGLYYDTIIQCQDNVKIQVHRCILGGRSPWFRHLLSEYHDSDSQDDYVLQISIDDVQSDVLNEILNFIYTNRCLISLKNAPDLLVAAKRFEIEKLRKQVTDFLLSRLTVENAIELLISAHEAGAETLKLACIRLINRNAEKIKRTEKWRTFKTEYVDLVPELYESRIERLVPVPTAFLPDVFSGPTLPSESLQTLTKLYENPVKRRLASPTVTIPASTKPPLSRSPTPVVEMHHHHHHHHQSQVHEPITVETTGLFVQQTDQTAPSVVDRRSPVKKAVVSKTPRRPAPTPAAPAPAQMRTFHPSVKQNSDVDIYRRSTNLQRERSTILPPNNQKQPPPSTHVPQKPPVSTQQKAPPSTQQKVPPAPASHKHTPSTQQKPPPPAPQKPQPPPPPQQQQPPPHKSPSLLIQKSPSPTLEKPPPPTVPTKMSRGVSPRYIIEIRESPTLSDSGPDDQITLVRERSIESMD